mmetsp:Transcript_132530/g.301289  ORF Transcript_132530/g.301289 Transcript_132530/m.301289 type:complete len:288 (-) Transcript_132530:88-951(-)
MQIPRGGLEVLHNSIVIDLDSVVSRGGTESNRVSLFNLHGYKCRDQLVIDLRPRLGLQVYDNHPLFRQHDQGVLARHGGVPGWHIVFLQLAKGKRSFSVQLIPVVVLRGAGLLLQKVDQRSQVLIVLHEGKPRQPLVLVPTQAGVQSYRSQATPQLILAKCRDRRSSDSDPPKSVAPKPFQGPVPGVYQKLFQLGVPKKLVSQNHLQSAETEDLPILSFLQVSHIGHGLTGGSPIVTLQNVLRQPYVLRVEQRMLCRRILIPTEINLTRILQGQELIDARKRVHLGE